MELKKKFARAVASWLFDAANPRERAQRPLERTTTRGLHEELNPTDRLRLVSDSRKLFTNLGPAKAAIVDKAVYSFGRAWAPQFLGADVEFGKRATAYLQDEFYGLCEITGSGDFQTQLHLASLSVDRDGDVGVLLTEDASGNARFQLIASNEIGARTDSATVESGAYRGLRQRDGVAINERGQPVAYCILGADESGKQDRWVSARDLVFLYEPEWVGQLRGLPCFSHAILDLRDLRTVQGYERLASAVASSIGLIEHNETGMPDLTDPRSLLAGAGVAASGVTTEDIAGGTVKYFRANSGSKLEFLKSERPGEAWESFMDRLIRNAYAGANWPFEMSWDSSKLGGANIRLIVSKAMRAVEDRQDLFRPAAKRIVGYAVAKAIKSGRLPESVDWWRWSFAMPQKLTVDYGRDSKSQREDYAAGIINLGDILAERGVSLDNHIAARKAENEKLKEAGLPLPGDAADAADLNADDGDPMGDPMKAAPAKPTRAKD
jgi:capsid protein